MLELVRADYFPTSIWHAKLNDQKMNDELLATIMSLRTQGESGVQISNRMGWQSPHKLHTRPEFSALCKYVSDALQNVVSFYNAHDFVKPVITDCWVNINPKFAYNSTHCHPNSYLSASYYVKVPADSGDLIFLDPRTQLDATRTPIKEATVFTAAEAHYKPEPGLLVIFPSWLLHQVEQNQGDDDRISIAFNTWMN